MAITINGTGTITGISAGGLPDAIITATELESSVAAGLTKAWINFNGTGTIAIRDSLNVSSITDIATGRYRVNFATAMSNANYCANVTGTRSTGWSANIDNTSVAPTTTQLAVCTNNASSNADSLYVCVSVFN